MKLLHHMYNESMGYVVAICAAVFWGLVYAIDQKLLSTFTPMIFLVIHSLITCLILIPVIIVRGESLPPIATLDRTMILLTILTVVLGMIANVCILYGVKILGSSRASIFEIMYPFFVIFFATLIYKEKLSILFFIGAVIMFIGAFIVIQSE